jgi:hypothetical protein
VPHDKGGIAVRQADEGCGDDLISLISGAGGGGDGAEHPVLAGGDALEGDVNIPSLREGGVEFSQLRVSEHGGA